MVQAGGAMRQTASRQLSAYVAMGSMVALACALVSMRVPSAQPQERLAAGKAKHHAHSATEKAIVRIQKKMMKSLDINAPGKESADPTQQVRDGILKEENDIASLKLASGNLFAEWEKERTVARDAQTKAVSLHEELSQDKTKERMERQKLESLKAKLAGELAQQTAGGGKGAHGEHGESGVSSREDISSYFASLNKEDKVRAKAAHTRNEQQAEKLEEAAGVKKARKAAPHKHAAAAAAAAGGAHGHKAQVAHKKAPASAHAVKAAVTKAGAGMQHAAKAVHGAKGAAIKGAKA
uniref:Uncharacterized protein n=1 Tax=Hemiselmis andersenii TaxID=464988 RepID=A0A6T8HQ67_HEMAN|mmetsp:Transcript_32283/g.75422  ORF Transcript_32283/g.75422 Transcript_32283/m.75422 type:complete len:295 (-) Transcript_32283:52-936(-)